MNLTPTELIVGGWLLFGAGAITSAYTASAAVEMRPGEMGYPRGWSEALTEAITMAFCTIFWPIITGSVHNHLRSLSELALGEIQKRLTMERALEALKRRDPNEVLFHIESVRVNGTDRIVIKAEVYARHSGTDGHHEECKLAHLEGHCRGTESRGDEEGPGPGPAGGS